MTIYIGRKIFPILCLLGLTACVGPVTPFGAINSFSPVSKVQPVVPSKNNVEQVPKTEISFYPDRKNLHQNTPLVVKIVDKNETPDARNIQIIYNGHDVTEKTLFQSDIVVQGNTLSFEFKNLKLSAGKLNDIQVKYKGSKKNQTLVANYKAPECSAFTPKRKIASTAPFDVSKTYRKNINDVANEYKRNPNFLAGIIAQESAFNPYAVSWAKALGLMQITPLAETEILRTQDKLSLPRYPRLNKYSYLKIKSLIKMGEVDSKKEWRLNPKLAMQGGMTYMSYLEAYWRKPKNLKLLESLGRSPSSLLKTKILLASYNSGAFRVKKSIQKYGSNWILHHSLHEARKYVDKIMSYCYHFSEPTKEGRYGKKT